MHRETARDPDARSKIASTSDVCASPSSLPPQQTVLANREASAIRVAPVEFALEDPAATAVPIRAYGKAHKTGAYITILVSLYRQPKGRKLRIIVAVVIAERLAAGVQDGARFRMAGEVGLAVKLVYEARAVSQSG